MGDESGQAIASSGDKAPPEQGSHLFVPEFVLELQKCQFLTSLHANKVYLFSSFTNKRIAANLANQFPPLENLVFIKCIIVLQYIRKPKGLPFIHRMQDMKSR